MIGNSTRLFFQELQKLSEPYAHSTTAPTQRDSFQQESLNERPLLLRDDMVLRDQDKGSATHFAAVILFAGMDVTISFIPRGSTSGHAFLIIIYALWPPSPDLSPGQE